MKYTLIFAALTLVAVALMLVLYNTPGAAWTTMIAPIVLGIIYTTRYYLRYRKDKK